VRRRGAGTVRRSLEKAPLTSGVFCCTRKALGERSLVESLEQPAEKGLEIELTGRSLLFQNLSNIDQRVPMPSRHTCAITARFRHSPVTKRSVMLPTDSTGSRYVRSTDHSIASRGGAAKLSQMPVAHGGPAHYLGTSRVGALDPAVHRVQAYPRGAGKRRTDEVRLYRLGAERPESATVRTMT
jgi:hypothetical protein